MNVASETNEALKNDTEIRKIKVTASRLSHVIVTKICTVQLKIFRDNLFVLSLGTFYSLSVPRYRVVLYVT